MVGVNNMDKINNLKSRGFHAKFNHDLNQEKIIGCIADIEDLVTFEVEHSSDIEFEFHKAVDDYMAFCKEVGKKKIKNCSGIAIQCRGKIVMAEPHPRFKGAWRYELNGETWVCSSWAFEEGY